VQDQATRIEILKIKGKCFLDTKFLQPWLQNQFYQWFPAYVMNP
jgi:hypothetical protein